MTEVRTESEILFTTSLSSSNLSFLDKQGLSFCCLPFIETNHIPAQDWALSVSELQKARTALVVTSKNGARALGENLHELPAELTHNIYATGPKTAAVLAEYDLSCSIPDTYNAGHLGQLLIEDKVQSVLHLCGNLTSPQLNQMLTEADISYKQAVVYKTTLNPVQINEKAFGHVVFMSPSAVESFAEQNQFPDISRYYAIGPVTAAALEKAGCTEFLISESATVESLVQTLKKNLP